LSLALVTLVSGACVPDDGPAGNPGSAQDTLEIAPGGRGSASQTAAEVQKARGLWVLAEGGVRVLDDPVARLPALMARARRLGASDLFVQVYRGGRAFYRAGPDIERAPAVDRLEAEGVDALSLLLDAAGAHGLRVHAWVNALSLSTRADAQLIERLGRDSILVDRRGRSLLDYPDFDVPSPDRRYYRMGTRGLYLDPGLPEVREHLASLFADLLARYPALDGLHLDYIRHPGVLPFSPGSRFGVGLEFGYGEASRAIYRAETGAPDPIDGAAEGTVRSASRWDDWRRDQVTRLVETIADRVREVAPRTILSAAVIAYVDRAYLSLAQDWRRWLEDGAIDLAVPMVYTLDDRLLRYQLESYAGWPDAERIWPGLGVWLFDDDPARAVTQVERLRRLGFAGEVLFSDDALADAPALAAALVPGAPALAAPSETPSR
jgi:uncharacterized lipoprotein YddW (UPF0748 family)